MENTTYPVLKYDGVDRIRGKWFLNNMACRLLVEISKVLLKFEFAAKPYGPVVTGEQNPSNEKINPSRKT